DVGEGAHEHAEISVEGAHASDGLRAVVFKAQRTVALGDQDRRWQKRFESALDGDRTGPGTTAAVWRRERLVQIEVHDVDTEVARPNLADQGVHVGAVHIEQAALGVQNLGDFVDLLLEDAQRVRVGEHERGNFVVHLRFKRGDLDHAAGIGLQILYRVAHHRSGGGVGTVC